MRHVSSLGALLMLLGPGPSLSVPPPARTEQLVRLVALVARQAAARIAKGPSLAKGPEGPQSWPLKEGELRVLISLVVQQGISLPLSHHSAGPALHPHTPLPQEARIAHALHHALNHIYAKVTLSPLTLHSAPCPPSLANWRKLRPIGKCC